MRKYILLCVVAPCVMLSGCGLYTQSELDSARSEGYQEGYDKGYNEAEELYYNYGQEVSTEEFIENIEYYYQEYGKSVPINQLMYGMDEEDYEQVREILCYYWTEEFVDEIIQ